tara:strand:- start:794 stop:979 length:186 start_codon:yes stop_codon:yes gene_type:complete
MRYVSDFIAAIAVRQAEIAASLANGSAGDFNSYQRLVGEYSGLQMSLDILNNLLREDEDDC